MTDRNPLEGILLRAPLHYPSAREWMWDYCIYLGPYTCPQGRNYDLGVYISDHQRRVSAAIVYGNEPGDYMSGDITDIMAQSLDGLPHYRETIRRAQEIGLIGQDRRVIS